jgi:hypothetical protein
MGRTPAKIIRVVTGLGLATGLALASTGCGSSSGLPPLDPIAAKNSRAVGALVAATASINAELDRQHRLGGNLPQEIRSKGLTPSLRRGLVRVFKPAVTHFVNIRNRLDSTPPGADPLLAKTQRTLSLWVARQIEADRIAVTARSNAEYLSRTKKVAPKIALLTRRLETLSARVQIKYPGVSNWKFLPNSS